jgi:dTDP-4-amino-4,6-dideoxygalactose transaminase
MLITADPKADYLAHASAIHAALDRVLESGTYILGPEVAAFEKEFAAYQGGGQVVGVANGTEALELALRAVGVGPGDAVATVANTVTATVAAIQQIGARPVFVEIDTITMTMSRGALEKALAAAAGGIRAIVPVHLYGQPAAMPGIMELARRHGVRVVEDCAQAHGAAIDGRRVGAWGDAAAFSFYPTKNLGAIGDGGAVFTRDETIAAQVALLRQYGWRTRYIAEIPGRNSRLDELQAAILRVKLPSLDAGNARRRALAARYDRALAGLPLRLPLAGGPGVVPVFHQYAVRTPHREGLRAALAAQGIHCGVLYPVPVHRQPAHAVPGCTLPETERACDEVLCLPCHPGVSDADADRVAAAVAAFFNAKGEAYAGN